jgi:hypothetical protein
MEGHDDCDDTDPNINPGVPEICDGIDNDCNARVDETCDYDGDGYTPNSGDCDDTRSFVYPGAHEDPLNGIDDNCNGCIDCRFEDMRDGTVLDTKTGLRWMKDTTAITPTSWGAANYIAANLQNGQYGLTDGSAAGNWSLPSVGELMSLVDNRFENPALCNAKGDGQWTEGDVFLHVDDRPGECLIESAFFDHAILFWTREYDDWFCCDCANPFSRDHCGFDDEYRIVDFNDGENGYRRCVFWFAGCWGWTWDYYAICHYNNLKVWPVRRDYGWSCTYINPGFCH